ncbi:MAG TPA: PA14 domain-containing protein [Anaerolineales bacterium]|jgi:4-amino-4-deoxy-L-arabinose transferase-like glycosyltransferase
MVSITSDPQAQTEDKQTEAPPVFRRVAAATTPQINRDLWILSAAFVTGGVIVWQLRQQWAREVIWPWAFLLAAMVLAARALRGLELWLPGEPVPPRLAQFSTSRRLITGTNCLSAAIILTGVVAWRLWPDYHQWHGTVQLWLVAIGLLLSGAWLVGAVGRGSPRAATAISMWSNSARNRWLEAAGFVLILALAIFLRTYQFNSLPPGIYVDETNGGLDALYILEGRDVSPFATGWYGTPNGYLYYMAVLFKLFGATWLGLKLVSLIPAILTVATVYLLARQMFGSLAGLSAMFLMAVNRWHLSMSRWGWSETAPPLFQVLAFFFLLRGLRDRRAVDYAIGGLLTGLSIYTYLSARLAVATLLLYVCFWLFSDPSGMGAALRRSWLGLSLFIAAALVAVAPIAVTYIRDPFTFNNRVSEVNILSDVREQGSLEPLVQNIGDMLKFFHQTGDLQGKHNLPGEPMADPITGLLFAIGVGYAVSGWRDQRRSMLLIWLVLGLAGSFLSSSSESPQAYRALTALPAVVLLAADVLERSSRAIFRLLKEHPLSIKVPALPSIAAAGLISLALAGAGLWESGVYFGRQASSIEVLRGFNPTENGVARETLNALETGDEVYLSPSLSTFSPLRFLVYGEIKKQTGKNALEHAPYQEAAPEVDLPFPDHGHNILMLLDSSYWNLRDYIASIYPQAEMELVRLSDQTPLYFRIWIPQSLVAEPVGLEEHLTFSDGRTQDKIVSELKVTDPGISEAAWTGAIRLEHGGEYEFVGSGGLKVLLDGREMAGRQYLGRGRYRLDLFWKKGTSDDPRLSWQVGDQPAEPVPVEVLYHLPVTRQGLTATYWRNMNWEGPPLFQQSIPFLMLAWTNEQPVVPNGPFSARFTGGLHVNKPGKYSFQIKADDGARFSLDGNVLAEGLTAGRPNDLTASIELGAGDHPIQIDYFQKDGGSSIRFLWGYNGSPLTPVPPDALIPVNP